MDTGASGGIGRATVGRLASAGHIVFAAHRKVSALHHLAEELPRMHPVILDVTEPSSIDRAFDNVQAETGGYGLDVLVNVAGMMILGPVEVVPDDLVQRQLPGCATDPGP